MVPKVPDVVRVKELLHYDPDTGLFTWAVGRPGASLGSVAGCLNSKGYYVLRLDGVLYQLHRLAWLYMTGFWPAEVVDHRNRVSTDNRWLNLRLLTQGKNTCNRDRAKSSSTTGLIGVSRDGSRFRATITVGKKRTYLGKFRTPEEAHHAYMQAKKTLHSAYEGLSYA